MGIGMIKKQTEHESKDAVKETIARLKANRKQADPLRLNKNKEHIPSSNTKNAHSTILRKRASKNASSVETGERKNAINRIIKKLLFGEMTQGEALKE